MNYHFPQIDFLSRRALAFSGIAAFHLLIAYLLLTALVQAPPMAHEKPTIGFVLPSAPPKPQETVTDFRPPDHVPIPMPPREPWAPPQEPSPRAPSATTQPAASGAAVVGPAVTVRVLGVNQLPNSEEFYPPDMRRQNIQGATNVRVCVDARGARVGEPAIEESSGFPPLDVGAVNVAKHGRYTKSMQGDTPVGNCFRFRITFKIPKK